MYLILLNKLKLTININGKYVLTETGERNGTDSLELEASYVSLAINQNCPCSCPGWRPETNVFGIFDL